MMMNSNNNNSNIMRPPGSNNGSYFDQGVIMLDDFAERVYNIFKKNFSAFMILSSIAYIIPCLPLIWFYTQFMTKLETIAKDMWNNDEEGADFDMDKTIANLLENMTALNAAAIWNVLLYCVLTVIGRGGITRAVAEIYVSPDGHQVDWKQCLYQGGTKRFCSLLCIGFVMLLSVLGLELLVGIIVGIFIWIGMMTKFMNLVAAGILLALIVFFVGILYLSCAWMIAFPVIVIESDKYNACSGFRRAWELSSGRRLTVYCTMVCYGVFQFVTNWTWQGLCFMLPTNYFTVPLRFIPGLFFLPLLAILQTVVYLNLRIDKEGMNNSVLQQDLMTVDHRSSEGGDMGGGDMVGSGGRGQTTDFAPLAQLDEDDDEEIGSIGSNKPSSAPLLSADDLPEATQVV